MAQICLWDHVGPWTHFEAFVPWQVESEGEEKGQKDAKDAAKARLAGAQMAQVLVGHQRYRIKSMNILPRRSTSWTMTGRYFSPGPTYVWHFASL